jgi:predicted ATPase
MTSDLDLGLLDFRDIIIIILSILLILSIISMSGLFRNAYSGDNSRIRVFESYLDRSEFGIYYFNINENMTWSEIRARYHSYRGYPMANMILNNYIDLFCSGELS